MLCLCSASASRATLLKEAGIAFVQHPVRFDEQKIDASDARGVVYAASKGKLEAAKSQIKEPFALLCADSVIELSRGTLAFKPKLLDEARTMLQAMSGSHIAIYSCVHLFKGGTLLVDMDATHFWFEHFDEDALEAYLQSGQWQRVAGACMIEGFCKPYIKRTQGFESTARGLQIERIKPWLGAFALYG